MRHRESVCVRILKRERDIDGGRDKKRESNHNNEGNTERKSERERERSDKWLI